jgi:hypothetical protein
MPDFTNIDPVIISQFWIYILGFFGIGVAAGCFICHILFKRQKDILKAEKESYDEKKLQYETREKEYAEVLVELQELRNSIKDSHEYWLYIENRNGDSSELSDFDIHNR